MSVSLPIGFNFRREVGSGITDVSPDVYISSVDHPYAASPGYGWASTTGLFRADPNTSLNPKIAGSNYVQNDVTPCDFRVDTGAGTFDIRLALGHAYGGVGPHKVVFYDGAGTTPLLTVTGAATGTNEWYDATGTLRASEAAWVSNNATAQVTITSTYLRVAVGGGAGLSSSQSSAIAHLGIAEAAAPPASGVVRLIGPGLVR